MTFRWGTDGAILRLRPVPFDTTRCPAATFGESLRSETEGAHAICVRPFYFAKSTYMEMDDEYTY